jgi:hypothetical protein
MVKKVFFMVLLISNFCFSQDEISSDLTQRVSFISKNRDTLILPNDEFGQLIYQSWDRVTTENKPKILFATVGYINAKNQFYYGKKEDDF